MFRAWGATIFILMSVLLPLDSYKSEAIAFQLMASRTSYEQELAGRWKVVSQVVWSDCPFVDVGDDAESEIDITAINGTLYPNWKTQAWTLVRNTSIEFNYDKTLYWERESKMYDSEDLWFVKSINKFEFDKEGQFTGKSHHKQYLNGEYVGAYITLSHLERVGEFYLSQAK